MANRDGHKVRVIIEEMGVKAKIVCPHIGKEYVAQEMLCAETVGDKVTGCFVDTCMNDIGWEIFQNKQAVEIKKAPFDIEWWVEGAFEDAELWISVIEDDDNTPYFRT